MGKHKLKIIALALAIGLIALPAWGADINLNDEINDPERLSVTFSQPVTLVSFTLYDLYKERDDKGHWYLERGYAELDGGPTVNFSADPSQGTLLLTGSALLGSLGVARWRRRGRGRPKQ
ncbi:MAG: hypothetical protein KKB57_09905 [Proteobacteria bacterium]|nr:hypothetical protein [Pseudomonadota bacterium]MBU2467759.1 hypothetical protein [Pseudomonadota bacterium]MBU2517886.1 hypothetical protein [Pseudomonadota bacterium]